jgi:hypothetical protein
MTRIVTTPAILRALVTAIVAGGLAAGCSSSGTATGRPDAQAPGLDAPAGSGGAAGSVGDAAAAGSGGSGGVTESGGVTATAGAAQTGGVTGSGGTTGAGGTKGTGGASSGGVTSSNGVGSTGGVLTSGGSDGTGGAGGKVGSDGGGTSGGPDGSVGSTGGPDASADKPPAMAGASCGSDDDCATPQQSLLCYSPGAPRGSAGSVCYACEGPSDCASDADCVRDGGSAAGTMICDVWADARCTPFCSNAKFCVLGCRTDGDCASGQACNERKSCEKTCVSYGGTCPVDFTCNASGFCRRILCKSDSDCSAFCVNGACYDTRGTCDYIPA